MSAETLLHVQAAVYGRLSGAGAVTSLLAGAASVYDQVPQGSAFPYIVLTDMAARPAAATREFSATAVFLDIETYSRAAGKQECQRIAAAIEAVLHEADLAVAGHRLVFCRIIATEITQVHDAATWRARQRLHVLVEPENA